MKKNKELVGASSFVVFNETDGVHASPLSFGSEEEAKRFIGAFRARYRRQGFYRTARGTRISPASVVLSIVAVKVEDAEDQHEQVLNLNGGGGK